MRKKVIYIHIGTHKTATTSVQVFLRKNSKTLQSFGVMVPESGTIHPDSGHHNIAWELRNDKRYENKTSVVSELIEELKVSIYKKAIISSEDFEYLSQYPKELRAFNEKLKSIGYKTIFIVLFRNKKDYAISLQAELMKHGFEKGLSEFKDEIKKNGYIKCHYDWYFEFNYEKFVLDWERILEQKINSYNYDEIVRLEGILPFFIRVLGISDVKFLELSQSSPLYNVREVAPRNRANSILKYEAVHRWFNHRKTDE